MAQFIIVTDTHGTKGRVNVDNIATYLEGAKDGGCKATIMLVNEFALEVQETFADLDSLIQNTNTTSIFSDRR